MPRLVHVGLGLLGAPEHSVAADASACVLAGDRLAGALAHQVAARLREPRTKRTVPARPARYLCEQKRRD